MWLNFWAVTVGLAIGLSVTAVGLQSENEDVTLGK